MNSRQGMICVCSPNMVKGPCPIHSVLLEANPVNEQWEALIQAHQEIGRLKDLLLKYRESHRKAVGPAVLTSGSGGLATVPCFCELCVESVKHLVKSAL